MVNNKQIALKKLRFANAAIATRRLSIGIATKFSMQIATIIVACRISHYTPAVARSLYDLYIENYQYHYEQPVKSCAGQMRQKRHMSSEVSSYHNFFKYTRTSGLAKWYGMDRCIDMAHALVVHRTAVLEYDIRTPA